MNINIFSSVSVSLNGSRCVTAPDKPSLYEATAIPSNNMNMSGLSAMNVSQVHTLQFSVKVSFWQTWI